MVLKFTFLVFLHSVAFVNSLNDEGLALLSFKQSLETSSTRFLDNWNSSDINPCTWNGVQCLEEKVISLCLPNTGLSGSLHLDIGKLPTLHLLNIRNNHFFGNLPIELLNATGLKSLVLSNNSFSGPIPSEIGNLKSLQNLDLSENSFTDSLPSSILHCKRLKILFLGGNNFTGSLPYGLGSNLMMLQKLNLSFNNFSGLIPNDLGNLSSLQRVLDLSHNFFDGPVPASLGDLPEYVYINLAYNNLSGPIPQNGALENAGPTAFVGNPLLCGLPLKVPCPLPSKPVAAPFETSGGNPGRKRWTHKMVLMAVSGGMIGLIFLSLSFCYWYIKFYTSRKETHVEDRNLEDKPSMRRELFCFRTDDLESLADHMEQYTFVPLVSPVNFDLEQLLKASAFLLGKSRRGIVYKAVIEKGPTVVVRRLEHHGSQRFREFQAEVETIGKIRHPNLVSLLAYCWCINDKLLIYEYVPNGDLASALHGSTGMSNLRPLSWSNRLKIAKGVAKGLAFLHDFSPKRLVHGNLKPSNILLGENLEVHISDIGLTRLAYTNEELHSFQSEQSSGETPLQSSPYSLTPTPTSVIGSSCYEAPEASKSAKPSQKWDVYAFGVILVEIVTGKSPSMQKGSSEMDLIRWIQLGIEVKPLADILDPFLAHHLENVDEMVAALKIGLACVHVNPDKRPSMRNVIEILEKLSPST